MIERAIYAPIWQLAFINGIGPRVGESGFGLIARFPYTAPYEDITIKGSCRRLRPVGACESWPAPREPSRGYTFSV
jgi:hypothetical protein